MTKISNITVGSTGYVSVTGVPFPVGSIDFYVSAKRTGTDSTSHMSIGSANGTTQMAHATFADASGQKSEVYFDRCIHHLKRDSSGIVPAVSAAFVSKDDNGSGDYGFTLYYAAADINYRTYFIVRP